MILKELTLNNFLSHESATINFSESEKILIDGKSGSGKSSVTEAIVWVLYGKGRTDNRSLIRRGSKNTTVSLKLVDGTMETIITRSVSETGKNNLAVTRNTGEGGRFLPIETTGLKDTQNWIEQNLLRASFELFTNSIVYQQENENSFVKANAAKRKDLLLEIIRAESFNDLYEQCRKYLANKEVENAVILAKILSLEDSIKRNTEIASKIDLHIKNYEETSNKLKSIEIIEKDLEKELNTISNATSQLAGNKRMIKILSDAIIAIDIQLDFNNKQIEEHNKIDPTIFQKDIEESEKLLKEIEVIEKELKESAEISSAIYIHMANKPQVFDYSKDIKEINERLVPLMKEGSKCPAGDTCPFIAPIQGQITYLKEQIIDKEKKSQAEKVDLEKWEAKLATMPKIKDSTEAYKTLKEKQEKIHALSKSKDLATKYLLFKDGLGELNVKQLSLKMEKDNHQNEILINTNAIKLLEEQLARFDINKVNIDLSNIRLSKQEFQRTRDESAVGKQVSINAQEALKIDIAELSDKKTLIIKSQEAIVNVGLLKEALGPKGIKAVVVDYMIPVLEERMNVVLSQMSDFRITLDTQTSTVDDGVKEGLFIKLKNPEGVELSIDNLSGGEKIKVSMAISEALASLMNSIGFRILDECINSLDNESTQSFVEVLLKLQEKFPQLLCVSHIQEVKDVFEKKIEIIKINGVSKIV